MNKNKLFLMLSVFVILMTVFGNAFAQDTSLPAFKVSSVVSDEKVVLTTKNFPADTAYTVSMASEADPDNFTAVAKFNSKTGGSLNVTVKIPAKFQGQNVINLLMADDSGAAIKGNFVNIPVEEPAAEGSEETGEISLVNQEPAAEEPVEEPAAEEKDETPVIEGPAAEEPAEEPVIDRPAAEEPVEEPLTDGPVAEEPAAENTEIEINLPEETQIPVLVCNYAITPTVHIDAVTRNESVTFTTANFPANSNFSVSMGVYVESWTPVWPAPKPAPYPMPYPFVPAPAPHFDPIDGPKPEPAPKPEWKRNVSFNGTEVGTFETADGSAQTLTFQIPASLKGVSPIAIWISDLGPCGFYSYNYFYNTSTN